MKNLFTLSNEVSNIILRGLEFSKLSIDIMKNVDAFIASLPKRTPKYHKTALFQVAIAIKDVKQADYVVFGYWRNNQFYTTYKGGHKLTTKYLLSTTNVLHDEGLTQSQWDGLKRGFYYASNLKPYFENSSN